MNYFVTSSALNYTLKEWQPRLIYAQLYASYPRLPKVLFTVFRAPESTAGMVWNHKIGKRAHSSLRCRVRSGIAEKQMTVGQN